MTNDSIEPELCLRVEMPICAFRPYESREYQDTHPVPPPSAVYGMLLSLCGVRREHKDRHVGVRMVLAIESRPERAKVFRKLRRGKDLGDIRPDYQDLLIGLVLWIWLRVGDDAGQPALRDRVLETLRNPRSLDQYGGRFGGLSLGESSYLVNAICISQPDESQTLSFMQPDPSGFYNLPIWIHHAANENVRKRFSIKSMTVGKGLQDCWFAVSREHNAGSS